MPSNRSHLQSFPYKPLIALVVQICLLLPSGTSVLASSEADNQYLDWDLTQLMQVTITSVAKKSQNLADTAAAVFVITQEDIRRSGVTSIPEALAMAPGLQVVRISASKWSIASRGFGGYTSNKLLVMIDGRSVYTPAYSGTFWDMQNTLLEDIDRIEVIRGPGGTIWGANAVNGVINIITKKAQDTQGTLLRASVGDQEKMSTAARYGGKIGESAFARLYVTTSDRDSNVLAGSDQDAQDGWRNAQGGFRMDGKAGSHNEWTLQGDLYKLDGNQIVFPFWLDKPNALGSYLTTDYRGYSASGANLAGKWQHRLNSGDLLTVNAYYDTNNRDESYYNQAYDTLDLNLQYETRWGDRNSLTMGTGFRQIVADFEGSYQVQVPDQTKNLSSAFLQDEIKLIADRLWLTLGTKYEHNDFTGSEWQPSARILWKPAADHSLWAAVARAVRTPAMIDDSGMITIAAFPARPPQSGTQRIFLWGNSNFNSETLLDYEVGYRWQVRRNLSLDVAAYYNDYDEVLTAVSVTNPSRGLQFSNALQGEGHGIEVAANWKTNSWLSLIFTYAWQEINLEGKDPLTKLAVSDSIYEMNNPKHQASVRSTVELAENWQFNCWLRYVDDIKGRSNIDLQTLIPTPSYFLLDANLIWKPRKDLEIMLAGQNLLNSHQLEYISEHFTPPTEIGRGFYGKATWRF